MGSNISAVAAQPPSRATRGGAPAGRDAADAPSEDVGRRDAPDRPGFGALLKDVVGRPAGRAEPRPAASTVASAADPEKPDAASPAALPAGDPMPAVAAALVPVPPPVAVLLPVIRAAAPPSGVAANPLARIDAAPAAAPAAAKTDRGLATAMPADAAAGRLPAAPGAATAGPAAPGPVEGAPPSQEAALPADAAAERGPASARVTAPPATRPAAPVPAVAEPPRAAPPPPVAADGVLPAAAAAPPREMGGVPRGQIRVTAAGAAAAPVTGMRPALSDPLPLVEDEAADAPAGAAASGAPDASVPGAGASLLRPVVETAAVAGQPWQNGADPAAADAPAPAAPAAHAVAAPSPEPPPVQAPATVHAAAAAAPAPDAGGPPAPPAQQILPAVVALAHGRAAGRSVSVSIAPEELGQVSITVHRRANGGTDIQVAAERLATLDLLKRDQGELVKALDQAGIGQDRSSLSFSWNGGAGGQSGLSWGQQEGRDGASRPPALPYGDEFLPAAAQAATLHAAGRGAAGRGGIDVTA